MSHFLLDVTTCKVLPCTMSNDPGSSRPKRCRNKAEDLLNVASSGEGSIGTAMAPAWLQADAHVSSDSHNFDKRIQKMRGSISDMTGTGWLEVGDGMYKLMVLFIITNP